jgi:hypothetical protein
VVGYLLLVPLVCRMVPGPKVALVASKWMSELQKHSDLPPKAASLVRTPPKAVPE